MKIYIISSWRNLHTVEILTNLLRQKEHEVLSFIEKNYSLGDGYEKTPDFETWLTTRDAEEVFKYDVKAATKSDLVIYIGPSGMDTGVELGMAYTSGIPIIGLKAKGEQLGLMRKVITYWIEYYETIFNLIEMLEEKTK